MLKLTVKAGEYLLVGDDVKVGQFLWKNGGKPGSRSNSNSNSGKKPGSRSNSNSGKKPGNRNNNGNNAGVT
ncbi:MAG: carbon storage regulator [Lachnospiraceae bacterium]|nr:carbon storage regulator [Lachnospiraceae bacterium]